VPGIHLELGVLGRIEEMLFLGQIEFLELGSGAAEPDPIRRGLG
jgi:hypothetical protein